MSQLLTQWQDWPVMPSVETSPRKYYTQVTTGSFSGSFLIRPVHGGAVQTAFQIGDRDRLSWGFRNGPSTHLGVSLIIHVGFNAEINTATSQDIWRTYRLNSQGITAGVPQNWMSGLKLPHLYCYFELLALAPNATVVGFLQLEGS